MKGFAMKKIFSTTCHVCGTDLLRRGEMRSDKFPPTCFECKRKNNISAAIKRHYRAQAKRVDMPIDPKAKANCILCLSYIDKKDYFDFGNFCRECTAECNKTVMYFPKTPLFTPHREETIDIILRRKNSHGIISYLTLLLHEAIENNEREDEMKEWERVSKVFQESCLKKREKMEEYLK